MSDARGSSGSAERWGPLFGARAQVWAETWEGPSGYGTLVYEYVLDRAKVESDTRILDCGCGAGRFARMAADRGAQVAGIDASEELIEIAAHRTPQGEFRVGDIEALPWSANAFDWVTGFNAFQFADDKARALAEAKRVSKGPVAVVIPSRAPESGITSVFQQLFPLFPPEALERMRQSGMFALSAPGSLEELLSEVRLAISEDEEIETPIAFDSIATAVRAFVGAGPMAIAVQHSGESTVARAAEEALAPFASGAGDVTLPGWYRVVLARG
jgi:ubiquinone/menaquinone biosynthesis C-methylase UbiE